jgi:hypothetical protein
MLSQYNDSIMGWSIGGSILASGKSFLSLQSAHTCSGTNLAFCSMATGTYFAEDKDGSA